MNLLAKGIAALAASLIFAVPALAADRAIIILDASGSMWTQIGGQSRIAIARQTLNDVLKGVPDNLELGFMAYGHRSKGSCDDIELMVPPAAGTAGEISAAAAKISPKGMTPLTAAVKQAAELLKYTEDKATVILITDGLETCNADPCALATELEKSGVDFTIDVVGFGLSASEGKQVACLANNTGGQYFQATDAQGLTDALAKTVAQVAAPKAAPAPAPEPAPAPAPVADTGPSFQPQLSLSDGGPLIKDGAPFWEIFAANADGSKGDSVTSGYSAPGSFDLKPGNYVVDVAWDKAQTEQTVTVVAGAIANPTFVLNAGQLKIHPRPVAGQDVDGGTAVTIKYPDDTTSHYGDETRTVPAGAETVTAELDKAKASVDIQLAAGQIVDQDLVLNAGHITGNATYAEGGDKVTDGGVTFAVLGAKKKIDGSRDEFGQSYGPDNKRWLPAGDYVMDVTMDQAKVEIPFTVTAGQETAVDADLEAGVAAIDAPGAQRIVIFGAKKKIDGSRLEFSSAYDAKMQTTLPAGDYIASAIMDDSGTTKEAPFTVKAGERTETTVPTGK